MDAHDRFFRSLTSEEEHLIAIRDFLYDGDWSDLVRDLRARKEGKPFVLKLNSRIDEDLRRIDKLSQYEREHGVNLGTYLVRSGKYPELAHVLPVNEDDANESENGASPSRVKHPTT